MAIHAVGQGLAQTIGRLSKHGVKRVDRLPSSAHFAFSGRVFRSTRTSSSGVPGSRHSVLLQATPVISIGHGLITLDIIRAEVRVEGEKVYLGPAEFRLLKYLMMTGRAVATTELINHLWDSDSRADESNVYNLVSRVRRLLDSRKKLDPIRSIREISGYGLRDFATDARADPH